MKNKLMKCLWCNRELIQSQPLLYQLFNEDELCFECRKRLKVINKKIKIEGLSVHGIYEYNQEFEKMIIQFKECMDEALKDVFLTPFKDELRFKYRNCVFVQAPSSEEKIKERGFEHVKLLFECCKVPIESWFIKTDDTKQANQNKLNRKQIREKIKLIKKDFSGKKVVLIDDVCTTGSTLIAMQKCMNEANIECVALVLALHPLLIEK